MSLRLSCARTGPSLFPTPSSKCKSQQSNSPLSYLSQESPPQGEIYGKQKMTRKQTELWQERPQIAKAFQVGNYSLNIFYGFLSTFPPKSILRTISRRSRIFFQPE